MKKSVILKQIELILLILCLLLLNSCNGFLQGAELKKELEEKIDYASKQSLTVLVYSDPNYGSTVPSNQTEQKINTDFNISFSPLDAYYFKNWKAIYKSTQADAKDAVIFEDINSAETKVRIISSSNDILIQPVTTEKPKVTFTIPDNGKENCVKNMSVKITFSKPMDRDTINSNSITVEEGVRTFINNDMEFIATDASSKLKDFQLSPSGKTLTVSLKDNVYYKDATTVNVKLNKNIKDTDGAPLLEDYSLSFSVSTKIDGLAPRIANVKAGIAANDYNTISSIATANLPDESSVNSIKLKASDLLSYATSDSLNVHIDAADISESDNTGNTSGVSQIGYRMACLYKIKNGQFIKTNTTDTDYYDCISYKDYVNNAGTGMNFIAEYPNYKVGAEVKAAPDGLYRIDVFAVDSFNNSGLTQADAVTHGGNGYETFYVLRDAGFEISTPEYEHALIGKTYNHRINKDGYIGFKIDEAGIGISGISVSLSKNAVPVTLTDTNNKVSLAYGSLAGIAKISDASLSCSKTNLDFTFASTETGSSITNKMSGYYYIKGLGEIAADGEYDLNIIIKDNAGNTVTKKTKIYVDNKAPWFKDGETTPANTTGSVVVNHSYGLGKASENVYPRPDSAGVTSADFWDTTPINSKDGVPVRWFYTNAAKSSNGSDFGIYLKTQFFDDNSNIHVKTASIDYKATNPDTVFTNFTEQNILNNAASTVEGQSEYETFYAADKAYAMVIYDDAGNTSPVYSFVVVKDNAQPVLTTENNNSIRYLMTFDEGSATLTVGPNLGNVTRNVTSINSPDYFDWYESSSHANQRIHVRVLKVTGTKEQIKTAKLKIYFDGTGDTSKFIAFGDRINNGNNDNPDYTNKYYLKNEKYPDSKPGKSSSGLAQYCFSRNYVNWRSPEGASTKFECAFPAGTDLNTRFTGDTNLYSSNANSRYLCDSSYSSQNNYFPKWLDYTAGTNIEFPLYSPMADNDSILYKNLPPITLCLKDNCGNINRILITRQDWYSEYATWSYQFN